MIGTMELMRGDTEAEATKATTTMLNHPPRSSRGKRAGRASLSDDEREAVEAFMLMLQPFFNKRKTMPLQYIKSLMLVAKNEGASVTELSNESQTSQSVMSRHLLDIGDRTRSLGEGMGLVTSRPNPHELRKSEYFLTPEGVALIQEVIRAMRVGLKSISKNK